MKGWVRLEPREDIVRILSRSVELPINWNVDILRWKVRLVAV